jgi:hypothetical protein
MESIIALVQILERIKESQKALCCGGSCLQGKAYGNDERRRTRERRKCLRHCAHSTQSRQGLQRASIKRMEIELKEAKKLADDLGDYQTLGFKESLVYMPPKELF